MSNAHLLGSYTLEERLYDGKGAAAYRAVRNRDQLPVILKILDSRSCRPQDVEQLKNAYELERKLDSPAVIRPLAFETYDGMSVVVMEDFGGDSLDRLRGPMPLGRFLPLAARIAAGVEEVHGQGLVHRNLRPENLLVMPATGEVRIANFGLATTLPREQTGPRSVHLMEGSLPYISPEQTGRMNRPIDSRSDLYSLGVTFYQMLTGRLPFVAEDLLGWVHSHIARVPAPPTESVASIPEIISGIVLKLLAKLPEDRYQSAAGLRHDLERCLHEWRRRGEITPFVLGTRDWSDRLLVPQKLYGREADAAALLAAFERTVATGVPELMLVSGYAGVGKSSLVQELHKPVVRQRGFFVSGKFEQYRGEIPYFTIAQACRELTLDALADGEDRVAHWKDLIERTLGRNGRVIADMVPELNLLIDPQPPVQQLPPTEAENRVQLVFRLFLSIFARADHPLTIFLDDAQWADTASLRLLQHVLTHPDTRYLFVIAAYRDNEVSSSHPLPLMVERSRKAGAIVKDLVLQPLSVAEVGQLIADALHCRPEDAAELAQQVHSKTAGNPFFAIHFIQELGRRGLIAFDRGAGRWRWDVAKIAAEGITDNVVDLMLDRLKLLPPATQEALSLCACLGNVVDAATLWTISGRDEAATEAALRPALGEDLLIRSGSVFRFPHDRVQEAAYSLIPEDQRAATHLRVGRLLLAQTPPAKLEEQVFDIVSQLNRAADLISSQTERDRVAELNLLAGNRGRASGAYVSGRQYFSAGSALLDADSWDRRHDLLFALELGRAECDYLVGNRDEAERTLSTLAHRAKDSAEAAAAASVTISLYLTESRPDRAVDAGLAFLRRVGIELSTHPPRQEVAGEYARMLESLGGRSIETLIDLPLMADPVWRGTMEVLQALVVPALATDSNLLCLLPIHMAELSLHYGNTDASCYGYTALGVIIAAIFGDYPKGVQFGRLGYDLVERRKLYRYHAFVYQTLGASLSIWSEHVRTHVELQARAFDAALEAGDLNVACYALSTRISGLIFRGDPLSEVLREIDKGLDFTRRAGFDFVTDLILSQQRLALSLRGKTRTFGSFGDAEFDEERFEARLAAGGRTVTACWYFVRKLQARFMAGSYAEALDAASKANEFLAANMVFLERAELTFYSALALAAHHGEASPDEKSKYREALATHDRQLAIWAENCPANFLDRHRLVSAEIARVDGETERAGPLYKKAIHAARKSGFVHGEGLAYELASRFYRARGFAFIEDASANLRAARACYLRCGADGKVQQIDRLHPRLAETSPLSSAGAVSVRLEQLDLLSVLRASQSISREIDQEKLLRTLLQVVLEEGGARTARVVLVHGDELSLEAEARIDVANHAGVQTQLLSSAPVSPGSPLPVSVLHYVRRTRERVLLDDARADAGSFAADPYIARAKSRSLLCQPVLRQDRVIALLVLENDLVPGVFTSGRLAALELLATQAAISIENALLLEREHSARLDAEAARAHVEVLLEDRQRAENEARFVAEASKVLSESLDYEATLGQVARLVVPRLADWCMIDAVEGDRLRCVACVHFDPAKDRLAHQLRGRVPILLESDHPAARALALGVPYIVPDATDEFILARSPDARHAAVVRELGTRSVMSVPLVAHGHSVGVITFNSAQPFNYGPQASPLVEEIARRAATAIENALLYKEAQDSIRARDEFLALASHELRTPVTSLLLMAQGFRSGKLASSPESIRRATDLFERELGRLRRLVEEMLSVGRILVGRVAIHGAPMDLAALVREEVARAAVVLARAHSAVTLQADEPVWGSWDRDTLAQVVTNLLTNAAKFGAGKPIEVRVDQAGGVARLIVVDHGIGIDAQALPHIFEKFERAVSSRSYGGLGLGLYIVRNVVRALGGTVRAQSTPDVETSFTIELPVAGPTSPASTADAEPVDGGARPPSP